MTPFGPLFWYELRRLPRRRAMHVWRMLYAAALLLGLIVVYLRMFRGVPPLEALANPGILDRTGTAEFANSFLMAFLAVQQIAVIVLTPIYAAGSIADEKERRTLDFLLSSPLSRFQIVFGKVCSRLVFIGGILAAGLPVLMLTLLFGGVDLEHLLAGFVVSAITAIFLANLGVLMACLKPDLRAALPGIALAILLPAFIGLCGFCSPEFSVVSPVTLPAILFRGWLESDPLRDSTWESVGYFVAVHAVISLILFGQSIVHLGEGSRADGESPDAKAERWLDAPVPSSQRRIPAPVLRRTYDVPPLGRGDDPLLWKELWFRSRWHSMDTGFLIRVVSVAILVPYALLAAIILFARAARELANDRSLIDTSQAMLLAVFPAWIVLWPAFVGVRAAASLGRERSAQTLATLFTLPIERREILKAIAVALVFRDRGAMASFAFVLVVGMIAGGVYAPFGLAAMILFAGCTAWAVAFGIWLSVRVETPARASILFVAVWGGVLLLPWFVAPFVPTDMQYPIEAICPPKGMYELLVPTRKVNDRSEVAATTAFATGLGMLALAAGFAWHAVRTFEREGK